LESPLVPQIEVRALPGLARSEQSTQLAEAWLRWRGDRMLPQRADVKLSDVARFLPLIGLLEVRGADDVHVRVAGTGLRELYGVEITRLNLKDITAPQDWPQRAARYGAIAAHPCGSLYARRDVLPNGRIVLYEGIALPIDPDTSGALRQVMFSLAPLDKSFAIEPPANARGIPMATEFRFIDIGAGVPAEM
jgi:hypothetical protein